ncbi:MAG: Txe/YoeB family addiction module toxin [Planctomycetia bacterium]|nr:Txe/YoeB family addiction module toxin [Planctomycetia bacterium]
MNIIFSPVAWEQLNDWIERDRKIARKIAALVRDIQRNGLSEGIGKPEPLKYRKAWSRRITSEHRLVYNFDEHQNLIILSCFGHYDG